jgi:hypothetical protein
LHTHIESSSFGECLANWPVRSVRCGTPCTPTQG